ncbi:MAG: hypothetical protein C5B49_03260 [Bdellovibrio sp.]|nr:MAG: hypothetical protein C5B49_03260 [Bdellovibrio sp.]
MITWRNVLRDSKSVLSAPPRIFLTRHSSCTEKVVMKFSQFSILPILFFLACFDIAGSEVQVSGEKVALIYDSSEEDPNSALAKTFKRDEENLVKAYTNLGYTVKVIRSDPKGLSSSGKQFRKSIADLRNTKDLHIALVGHGDSYELDDLPDVQGRFPMTIYSAYESRASSPDPEDPFLVGQPVSLQHRFAVVPSDQDLVGLGDLRRGIHEFQRNNKDADVVLTTGNCFGGLIPLELSDMDHFLAMSATHGSSYASDFSSRHKGKSYSFETSMAHGLCENKSLIETQEAAQQQYFFSTTIVPPTGNYLGKITAANKVPRNSVEGYVEKWCDQPVKGVPTAVVSDPAFSLQLKRHTQALLNKEIAHLQSMQKSKNFCSPEAVKEMENLFRLNRDKLWENTRRTMLEVAKFWSQVKYLRQLNEDRRQGWRDDEKTIAAKSDPNSPVYQPLRKWLTKVSNKISETDEIIRNRPRYLRSVEQKIKTLDQCLLSHDYQIKFCSQSFNETTHLITLVAQNSKTSQKNPCFSAETNQGAMQCWVNQKPSSKLEFLANMLWEFRANADVEQGCQVVQRKIELDQHLNQCVDRFISEATADEREHVSRMMSLAERRFGQCAIAKQIQPRGLR